jgi:hypothetical protein
MERARKGKEGGNKGQTKCDQLQSMMPLLWSGGDGQQLAPARLKLMQEAKNTHLRTSLFSILWLLLCFSISFLFHCMQYVSVIPYSIPIYLLPSGV